MPCTDWVPAHELNHELMAVGFVLSKDAFDAVASLEVGALEEVYRDLISGIRRVVGDDGYEPIYRNFPQSVGSKSTATACSRVTRYARFCCHL